MKKYIVIFVILVGIAFFIARQDERAAQQSAKESTQLDKRAFPADPNEKHPDKDIPDSKWDAPSWLIAFFRWPNGTATWVVILTMMAIAEQTKETAKAAQATQASAKATAEQSGHIERQIVLMENSERPWISFIAVPVNLTFGSADSGGGATLTVKFTMKNAGKSIALDVNPNGKLITPKGVEVFSEPLIQQAKVCGKSGPEHDARNPYPMVTSTYLFPGDEREYTLGVHLPQDEMYWMTTPADHGGRSYIEPILVGCIEYRFSLKGELHHTFFNLNVSKLPTQEERQQAISSHSVFGLFAFEIGKNAPAEEIWLVPSFSGGNYVD
jgi:hypothetical protein